MPHHTPQKISTHQHCNGCSSLEYIWRLTLWNTPTATYRFCQSCNSIAVMHLIFILTGRYNEFLRCNEFMNIEIWSCAHYGNNIDLCLQDNEIICKNVLQNARDTFT